MPQTGFPWWLSGKESSFQCRTCRKIPWRNSNPRQYSCLGNPLGRGDWRATVHGITRVRHDLVKQQLMPQMLHEIYLPCKIILCLSEIQMHLYFYLLNLTTCAQEQGSPGFACQLCSWLWCWLYFWGLYSRLHAGWSGLSSDQSTGGREKVKCFWTIFGSGRLSSRVPASATRPAVDLELHGRVSCSFHPRLPVCLRLCITQVTHCELWGPALFHSA